MLTRRSVIVGALAAPAVTSLPYDDCSRIAEIVYRADQEKRLALHHFQELLPRIEQAMPLRSGFDHTIFYTVVNSSPYLTPRSAVRRELGDVMLSERLKNYLDRLEVNHRERFTSRYFLLYWKREEIAHAREYDTALNQP